MRHGVLLTACGMFGLFLGERKGDGRGKGTRTVFQDKRNCPRPLFSREQVAIAMLSTTREPDSTGQHEFPVVIRVCHTEAKRVGPA
jgi:hypothetical protein